MSTLPMPSPTGPEPTIVLGGPESDSPTFDDDARTVTLANVGPESDSPMFDDDDARTVTLANIRPESLRHTTSSIGLPQPVIGQDLVDESSIGLPQPVTGEDLVDESPIDDRGAGIGSWAAPFAGALAIVAILVVVGAIVFEVMPLGGRDPDDGESPSSSGVAKSPVGQTDSDAPGDGRAGQWTDAEHASLRLGVYDVRVTRAEFGTVQGRDTSNAVVPLADACLVISLRIQNVSPAKTDYVSWYGESVREGGTVTVDLTDNAEHQYALQAFAEGQKLRGHTPRSALDPGQRVDDVLIFHVGPELDHEQVKDFYLWLDGSGQGVEGSFQFRIPASMVTHW